MNDLSGTKGFDARDPMEAIRQKLVEHIGQIIKAHRATDHSDGAGTACGCGAERLPDHCGHVAEQIVDGLDLKLEGVDEAKKQIRYASAWLSWELTKLEGAEC
jgi:hypothetical protein